MTQLRDIKSASFFWLAKPATRKIREAFDATNDVSSALGVYAALCEIASDSGSEQFQTTHSWIQRISGWSVRTIQARLKALNEIGLVDIHTPDLRAPSTYKLLSVAQPLPSDAQPLPSVRQLAKQASLPTSEEREKNLLEERENKGGAHAPPLPLEVVLWNSKEQLPKVQSFTQKRQQELNARKKDPFFVQNFEAAIELVCKSDFCLGENSRDWRADFDWILQPNTVAKIMEGKYQNKPAKAKPGAAPTISQFEPKEGKVEM